MPPRALLLFAFAGCTQEVVLGADCSDDPDVPCIVGELDAGVVPPLDAATELDATHVDYLDANDARQTVIVTDAADGEVIAIDPSATWALPALENKTFTITDGQPGDVATYSLPTGTVVAPWLSCAPLGAGQGTLSGVRAERFVTLLSVDPTAPPEVVMPTHGDSFIGLQYLITLLPPVLVQQLDTPLRAGERYGLAIDVRTSNTNAKLALQVNGSVDGCANAYGSKPLAMTDPIVTPGWQTVCLRFTAPVDESYLIFAETSAVPVSGDRLFIDNIRSVESCP